jgi:hypothetical protein
MHKPLAALLSQDRIITDPPAADRWQPIDELLGKLIESHTVDSANRAAITAVVRKHADIRQALQHAPDAAAILQLIRHHKTLGAPPTVHP